MAGYHKYVFDEASRKLVGDFEGMYSSEETEGFDSWLSADLRAMRHKITNPILSDYNFDRILEVGCGKGYAASTLKKINNKVVAIDVSPTAIKKAKASFPEIDFRVLDASSIDSLKEQFDLIAFQAVLAYLPNWQSVLATSASMTEYCLVSEYVPPNPIGMVKSIEELRDAFGKHYNIVNEIILNGQSMTLFGTRRSS